VQNPGPPSDSDRRDFVKKAAAVTAGAIATAVPICAGVAVFLDPLRRSSAALAPIRVTTLDALPADGIPRQFSIFANQVDAWNKYPQAPIGAIYLRRTADKSVQALNVVCPHAGCFVDYIAARNGFFCPCHNSHFGVDGKIADERSPSPRALDTLEVEIRNETEVWVRFQNFRAGRPDKIPLS
jgi:menaquinol-cytochrome c reductase iron-sulfur subunit